MAPCIECGVPGLVVQSTLCQLYLLLVMKCVILSVLLYSRSVCSYTGIYGNKTHKLDDS